MTDHFAEERPYIKIPVSLTEVLVEFLSLLGLLFLAWYAMIEGVLPSTEPGGRSIAPIITFAAALILYFIITFVRHFHLHRIRYPVAVTRDNANRHYDVMRSFLSFLKAEIVWNLAISNLALTLGPVILVAHVALTILMFATIVYFISRFSQAR